MSWQRKAQFQSVGPCLVFVGYVYFVWYQLLRLSATNCWVRKSACLYNNCQYSGVDSDWGRGDLHNVIRKGPTLFSLLPQSRPSHYPRSEDYGRIAFLLPTQFLSFYCLWHHHARQPSHHQQRFPCSTFNTFSPCHYNQVRDTGHRLSSLIVKFLIFIFFFFQAWELFMIS